MNNVTIYKSLRYEKVWLRKMKLWRWYKMENKKILEEQEQREMEEQKKQQKMKRYF